MTIWFYITAMTTVGDACQKKVIVRSGDTLAQICRVHLGKYDPHLLRTVLNQNQGITHPDLIRAGDVICLDVTMPHAIVKGKNLPIVKPVTPVAMARVTKPAFIRAAVNRMDATSSAVAPARVTYPPPMPGSITQLTWLDDNTAIVEGRMDADFRSVFYVHVPGDLEYEQTGIEKPDPFSFRVRTIIGRQGRDYGQSFILKLALYNASSERFAEITRQIIRKPHSANESIVFSQPEMPVDSKSPVGWPGLESWMAAQELDALKSDNVAFRVPNGRLIVNYRYLGYNPDEKYLSRYGRITLYGSSCLAKALLLKGEVMKAEQILRPWAAQVSADGKIPRSANVLGDNYISPDVRTGEVAHFFGVLALAGMMGQNTEWEEPIRRILTGYIIPLIDSETGLVKGGYNGVGSEGYTRPPGYEKISWCSTEHNLDLFQALILAARVYRGRGLDITCENLAWNIGKGIDQFLWDEVAGTFNQGWRPEGLDRAKALDCCSWGALYLIKQARLSAESKQQSTADLYLARARRCLEYADNHFQTNWYYRTPEGKEGKIKGYRPYDGEVADVRYEEGPLTGKMIDWSSLNDIVWSEGTLGVAKAWEELARETGDPNAKKRMQAIYQEMLNLQRLSDKGGLLYSTKQIKGHFTMGEELASIGWLGYLSVMNDSAVSHENRELIKWMAW